MTDTLLCLLCICCGLCTEYHLYCLTPPLTQVPLDEWFCPQCAPPQPQQRPAEPAAPALIAPIPVHTLQVLPKRERGQGAVPPPTVLPHTPAAGISPSANQSQHTVTPNGETVASASGPSQQQQAPSSAQQSTQSTGPSNGSSSVAPPLQQHPVPPPLSVSLPVFMSVWLWYLKFLFVYLCRWLTRLKAMLRRATSY